MQMPERARIRALKEEVIKRIEEANVRNFPGCEGKLFLISTAYPGVWLEHAYDAVSYANYTPEGRQVLAGEMRLFLDRQWEDGQLPCYVLDETIAPQKGYKTMIGFGQIQECVSFTALCLETAEMLGDEAFLAEAYEKCARWEGWLVRNRMTTQDELVETFCVYDTGHDNSARLTGIPNGCPGEYAANRPDVKELPLLSPDVNAVFFGTRMALSKMAERLGRNEEARIWREKAENVRAAILQRLYDPETDYFYDVDAQGRMRKYLSISAMSLYQEHVLEGDAAERIYRKHFRNPAEFWTAFPFPSLAANDPAFRKTRTGNDWGYYSEGLTALRALRWMDDYGKGDDLNELLSRWVMALANAENSRFAQEIDPLTGEPAQVSEWYSSAMLLFLHGVKRLGLA